MTARFIHPVICVFSFLVILSCNSSESSTEVPYHGDYFKPHDQGIQTGGIQRIPISTPKANFTVWTKRIGNNPKLKVLLLTGGPGCTHEYFECFESFFPKEGIEFIYYDQLGCGFSDHPNDTSLWDLPRFVDELEQVRIALGLDSTNCVMLGHSWGGILAMEYALKYQDHMKGLVISNMMSSCPEYGKYANEVLAKKIDPNVLQEIKSLEAKGAYSDPRYMELLLPNFYSQHICRIPLDNWPDPVNRSFDGLNQSLYVTMQGPSEFGIAGKLANWDRSKELKNITIPTLTIGATHDTMDPEYMRWMSEQVKVGAYHHCPNGSHMCFYDDQQTYFTGLISWLKKLS